MADAPSTSKTSTLHITCGRGVAPALEQELKDLGFEARILSDLAVETTGDMADAMRLNLHLRTAHRVLLALGTASVRNEEELFRAVLDVDWEEKLSEDGFFSVTCSLDSAPITDNRFAALKVKDAVADRMTRTCGRRPDSGSDRSRAVLHLHWAGMRATLYLDTSGEPLARRTYRKIPLDAPMQETLAAACILNARWNADAPFVNPMCGSGTLAIEAALIATRCAPGLLRENFAFMHLKSFDAAKWKALREEARALVRPPVAPIVATDRRDGAVQAARKNAEAAGMADHIEFGVCDFEQTVIPPEPGMVILNPEYGNRLGDVEQLEPHYKAIGDFFKQNCGGYMAYVFTGNLTLAKRVGLRSKRRLTFFSGGLECRLLEFELYSGTRKPGRDAQAS